MIMTQMTPMMPPIREVFRACCPSCAPTTCERISSSSREREPIRMEEASSLAESSVKLPEISHFPSVMACCTTGELIVSPS